MVGRPARGRRRRAVEAERRQIQCLDKGLDHVDRVVLVHPVLETFGKQRQLRTVGPFDKTTHPILPRILAGEPYLTRPFSHSQGHQSPSVRLELMSALMLIPEIWDLEGSRSLP